MEKKIKEIIEKNYKGVTVGYVHAGIYSSDYITLVAIGMKHRNMPWRMAGVRLQPRNTQMGRIQTRKLKQGKI